MDRRLALIMAASVAACAGKSGPQPTGVVNGGVNGHGVIVGDVASAQVTSGASSSALIVLSTAGDVCGDAGSNIARAGAASVAIELIDNASSAPAAPTIPGTYAVTVASDTASAPAAEALVTASFLDASCAATGDDLVTGTSGTVTLTVVDAGAYSGQFDVVLASGDRTTGDFVSVACASLSAGSGATPTCN